MPIGLVAVAAGVVLVSSRSASAGTSGPAKRVAAAVTVSTSAIPQAVIAAEGDTPYPIPAGATTTAAAAISTGTFVYADYISNRSDCDLYYFSAQGSTSDLTDTPGGIICRGSEHNRPAADLHLDGGQADNGAFILFGSVPSTATSVQVRDTDRKVFSFSVPNAPLRTDAGRDVFISDLSQSGITGVTEVSVISSGKVIGSLPMGGWYTDDWAAQNYDMNYNIYVESPGNTRHETGSQWSCQQDPGYWWKCVSSVYGHSHPSSFKTAYNYPRLVFEGNTSGAGDAFAEWEWGNGGTSQQGAACSIY